ncbi:uncharacterized protein LOC141685331 [Apium graveolens]|uniref:uncharacterized protein LOC141685331 n=1 Tax=Apium graveolens TaxID=4045 RepID=UPI003D7AE24E
MQNLVFGGNVETGEETIKRVFQTTTKEKSVMFSLLCWGLWMRRNKWVWEKINMSVFGVKHMAINFLSTLNRANARDTQQKNRQIEQAKSWSRPLDGWVKVNNDAACNQEREFVAVGCVVRDASGHFLRAMSNIVRGARSPREVEALSMREALSWIKDRGSSNSVYESDSKLLIDAMDKQSGSSLFHTIVEDCNELAKYYENVLF